MSFVILSTDARLARDFAYQIAASKPDAPWAGPRVGLGRDFTILTDLQQIRGLDFSTTPLVFSLEGSDLEGLRQLEAAALGRRARQILRVSDRPMREAHAVRHVSNQEA